MSSTYNGSALQTRFTGKHGFNDASSLTRILEYINDIQDDLTAKKKLPFLKFKMKKLIAAGTNQIDLSPQIPGAPTAALAAGGSLTIDTAYYVKVAFVLFDENGQEFSSIESEPSVASALVTTATGNLTIGLTAIPTYSGAAIMPTTIYRRIYLKKGTADYFLSATITDNTTTALNITADTTSLVEPVEYSMVDMMAGEDPSIAASGRVLQDVKLDDIIKNDPARTSSGTPQYYSRIGNRKIEIYPAPSTSFTLSYWIYRTPARIFADTSRVIQLDHSFKQALDAGVTWKGYEYKDEGGVEGKLGNYLSLKQDAINGVLNTGGQAHTVKVVC